MANKKYAKKYITQALFRLMRTNAYDKITIVDIIRKAGVSRITYYRNFSSKNDIIIQFFGTQIGDYEKRIFFLPRSKEDYWEIIFNIFTMFYDLKDDLKLLLKANLQSLYLDFLNIHFVKLFTKMETQNKFTPYFYSGALYNISIAWLRDDCKESVKNVTNALYDSIFNSNL